MHIKRPCVNFLAFFLLLMRFSNIMYRVFNYDSIRDCIQTPAFIFTGIGVQIVAQILSLKFEIATYLISFVITLSYMNLRFCVDYVDDMSDMAVLADTLVFEIFVTILLSMNWLLSSIGSFCLKMSLFQMLTSTGRLLSMNNLIIYPLCLCWIIQTVALYLIEKDSKLRFVLQHKAKRENKNFKAIFDGLGQIVAVLKVEKGRNKCADKIRSNQPTAAAAKYNEAQNYNK